MSNMSKNSDIWLLGAILLLMAAWFNPVIPLKRDLHNYLFIVDITQSMNTADMRRDGQALSRIAYTRRLLSDMVSKLPCDSRVSLGVFSAESVALLYTPISVCKNYDVIQDSIAHLEWRMAWRGNSRLRFGVQSASAILDSLTIPAQVVFFTDGDEAPKLNAVNKTDLSGWHGGSGWLLVGVGGDEPFPIPKLDSENRILGYWAYSNSIMAPVQVQSEESVGTRDNSIASEDYNRYLSKLDEPYLKELSTEIGASYIRASDAEHLIEAVEKQPPAGYDTTRYPARGLCLLTAMAMMLAGYWPNFLYRTRQRYFTIIKEPS